MTRCMRCSKSSAVEAVDEWQRRLDALKGVCERSAAAAQDQRGMYYDAARCEIDYAVGQRVWKKNHVLSSAAHGITAKLAPKFSGPLEVVRRLGSKSYLDTYDRTSVHRRRCAIRLLRASRGKSALTRVRHVSRDPDGLPRRPCHATILASRATRRASDATGVTARLKRGPRSLEG